MNWCWNLELLPSSYIGLLSCHFPLCKWFGRFIIHYKFINDVKHNKIKMQSQVVIFGTWVFNIDFKVMCCIKEVLAYIFIHNQYQNYGFSKHLWMKSKSKFHMSFLIRIKIWLKMIIDDLNCIECITYKLLLLTMQIIIWKIKELWLVETNMQNWKWNHMMKQK